MINRYPKDGITVDQLEEMLGHLSSLLSTTHWMMMEIQQKLFNMYAAMKVRTTDSDQS